MLTTLLFQLQSVPNFASFYRSLLDLLALLKTPPIRRTLDLGISLLADTSFNSPWRPIASIIALVTYVVEHG